MDTSTTIERMTMNDTEHAPLSAAERDMLTGLGFQEGDTLTDWKLTEPEVEALTANMPREVPSTKRYSDEIERTAARLLTEAGGDLTAAKLALLEWINVEHDKVKLNKAQGQVKGVNSSQHNKDEWHRLKKVQTCIGAAMRRQVSTGHVKAQIRNAKEAS